MRDYHHIVDRLTIITGGGGVFDVQANGQLLFSKKAVGRHAEPGEVLAAFRELLGPGVMTYEQLKHPLG
jgi:selenoprotein W-related protein